uniref:Uncharacterized protein n=1 Tax=Sinocyclocheilus anshuiensis TaxID=1608454 RepID=A0A671LQ72_9TELE
FLFNHKTSTSAISLCFFFFFILKGQNYVQTEISLEMFLTLDWFLAKKYFSMPSSSWSDPKDGLERGQFDYALV